MKRKLLYAFALSFATISVAKGQEKFVRCATMEADEQLRINNPQLESLDDFENWLAPKIEDYKKKNNDKSINTLPVIIHIIHNSGEAIGQGRNISNAQAVSQITVLNEDFHGGNADIINTPTMFQPVAADCEIQFCLAAVDPSGNTLAEPGIHRVDATTLTSVTNTTSTNAVDGYTLPLIESNIKPVTQWDPDRYLNIWVLHLGEASPGTGQLLGYAQFPSSSGLTGSLPGGAANTDGVVIWYNAFGNTGNVNPTYPLGRTATHEVGHWLGVRHIWGDANCGDDFCSDTPTQQDANGGCPTHPSPTCGNNGDMFMNFMDYCNDACLVMFTLDQSARMNTVLQNSPRRGILNTSTVCTTPNEINESVLMETNINIFPNPSTGEVNIELNSYFNSQIVVYNYLGEKINEIYSGDNSLVKFDMNNYRNGVYFIQIKSTKGVITKKIILDK